MLQGNPKCSRCNKYGYECIRESKVCQRPKDMMKYSLDWAEDQVKDFLMANFLAISSFVLYTTEEINVSE